MPKNVEIPFTEISRRLRAAKLPVVDAVVGIAKGGIVPASMIAHQLDKPLAFLHINYRAEDHSPRYERPVLLTPARPRTLQQRLLLVDDVSVTGKTLALARQLLLDCEVTTLVLKGKGDIVLFPEVSSCVQWPWLPSSRFKRH
jgi:hypoxanthine phosphoribosyltransferase